MADLSPPYEVRAITRAMGILHLIEASSEGMSLGELSQRSGLTKPTVFRMVRNLEYAGLAERIEGTDRYRLGIGCVSLGHSYLRQIDFRREALPILGRLRDAVNETVHLAVLDTQMRVVYLEKLEGSQAVGVMMSAVGRSAPSYCTGLGKALLAVRDDDPATYLAEHGALVPNTPNTICDPGALRAELAAIRRRGYALDLEEHEIGVRCVATTIRSDGDKVVAALSVAGPAQRLPLSLMEGDLAGAVMDAAKEISRRLGASGGGK